MSLAKKLDHKISEKDYLKSEIDSDIRYEYIDGYIFAMAGASKTHNQISGNIFRELGNQLKLQNSPCSTFTSDMKVKISNINKCFYYPDVMVSCDDNNNEDEYYIKSPKIIIEVLSKSTRKMDSTTKMIHYFTIESLEEYVLIEQDFCEVQVFKKSEGWKSSFYFLGDEITFSSLSITIPVEDIYYQIKNEDMIEFISQKEE